MPRSVFTDDYRRLISLLAGLRRDQGITQAELALKLGTPQSYISKVERMERRLDVIEYCDFIQGIGLEPTDVLAKYLQKII